MSATDRFSSSEDVEPYTPITEEWLKENGYGGFVNPGECGCRIPDLRPCGEVPRCEDDECELAYETVCTSCGNGNCMPLTDEEPSWCMTSTKPTEVPDEWHH